MASQSRYMNFCDCRFYKRGKKPIKQLSLAIEYVFKLIFIGLPFGITPHGSTLLRGEMTLQPSFFELEDQFLLNFVLNDIKE